MFNSDADFANFAHASTTPHGLQIVSTQENVAGPKKCSVFLTFSGGWS
jgi:hypothetical protein